MLRVRAFAASAVAVGGVLLAGIGEAATYDVYYQASPTSYSSPTPVSSNADSPIQVGDLLNYHLDAVAGYEWSNGTNWWAIQWIGPDGATRTADYSYSFSSNGAPVQSGSMKGLSTSFAHLGADPVSIVGLTFDEFYWSALVTDVGGYADFISPSAYFQTDAKLSAVPLPAAAWLFGSALMAVLGFGRRKQGTSGHVFTWRRPGP